MGLECDSFSSLGKSLPSPRCHLYIMAVRTGRLGWERVSFKLPSDYSLQSKCKQGSRKQRLIYSFEAEVLGSVWGLLAMIQTQKVRNSLLYINTYKT